MVDMPIKRGTSSRLGLRLPRPRLLLRVGGQLSDGELQRFRAEFAKAMRNPVHLVLGPSVKVERRPWRRRRTKGVEL
ncbi:hypothetical protein BAY59_24350 [Prauserella coralliicola]|nr:hypothetical protein BAY59_24350 [Prauserella coralliicola]